MRRQIVYPGQVPLETDALNTNRNVMIALGKLAGALFGTGGIVNGLAVTPTQPASLSVQIGAGEIYQLENIDNTAYSSLAADTTDTCVKQGIQLQPVVETITPPNTAGYSQCFLIEATFQEVDGNNVVLPYYNSSNPNQALNGPPGNPGQQQPTQRDGQVFIQVKAGIAATTGTQQAPTVDPGYVGLAVVTVANGQASITAAHIAAVTNNVLPAPLLQAIQNDSLCYAKDTGAANALVVNLQPAPAALVDGMMVETQVAFTNTGAATLDLNSTGANPVVTSVHSALRGGELVAGGKAVLMWSETLASWILIDSTGGAIQYGGEPPQFDSSMSLATTSFVQRALGNFSNLISLTASTVLSAENVGAMIFCAGNGPYKVTLPSLLAVNIGAAVPIHCTAGSGGVVTIAAAAGDSITLGTSTGNASFTMSSGDDALLVSNGVTWVLSSGSSSLKYNTGVFGNSLVLNGYQKLPNGNFRQWGRVSVVPQQTTTFNFPIAFPNACLSIVGSLGTLINLTTNGYGVGIEAQSNQQFMVCVPSSSTGNALGVNWIAEGF